jgi:DNA-binding NarL/FixJ family response regulator
LPHRIFVVASALIWAQLLRDRMVRGDAFDVVGITADGDRAIREIDRLVRPPHMVVLDVNARSALAAATTLRCRDTGMRLVAIGLEDDPAQVLAWATAGAKGLLSRTASLNELLRTVTLVTAGKTPCSPDLIDALLRGVERGSLPTGAHEGLTERQYQVAQLLAEGLTNKEIASRLQIESGTVKAHVHSVIHKLGISRRAQVAARLRRDGVTASSLPVSARGTEAATGGCEEPPRTTTA